MDFRILRNESRISRTGADERFLLIEIDDGNELYTRAEWLTPADAAQVIEDPTYLDIVALAIAQRGIRDRPAAKAREEHARAVQLEMAKKIPPIPPGADPNALRPLPGQ
jgi:hypothetical protein